MGAQNPLFGWLTNLQISFTFPEVWKTRTCYSLLPSWPGEHCKWDYEFLPLISTNTASSLWMMPRRRYSRFLYFPGALISPASIPLDLLEFECMWRHLDVVFSSISKLPHFPYFPCLFLCPPGDGNLCEDRAFSLSSLKQCLLPDRY